MKVAIVIFDNFTDLDLWMMWDLLNRVRRDNWEVKILGENETHFSATKMEVKTHGRVEEANESDAVFFVSGYGTRAAIADENWLAKFDLDKERQFIGSICSGSLILAKLGLLDDKTATTYPTTKETLENFGIEVVEKPFIAHGKIATAGGCLAQQYLAHWMIENLAGRDLAELIVKSIQPVGEGLFFDDLEEIKKLYAPVTQTAEA